MTTKMKKCTVILCILMLASCGGGSGNDPTFNGGVWIGNATLSENVCNLTGNPGAFAFTHNVTQNDNAVALTTDQNVEYVGNTLSDQGFSVDNTGAQSQPIGAGITCNYSSRIEYDGVFADDDTDADVEITYTRECSNNTTCIVRYDGTALRNLG